MIVTINDEKWGFICCTDKNWHKCSELHCILWWHHNCLKLLFNVTNREIKRISKKGEWFTCPKCKCDEMQKNLNQNQNNKKNSNAKNNSNRMMIDDANDANGNDNNADVNNDDNSNEKKAKRYLFLIFFLFL